MNTYLSVKKETREIGELYDELFIIEGKKRGYLYPIHKKLKDSKDIYEQILELITLPESGRILDAGCGVGYGTLLIAANTKSEVEGISVSNKELEQAIKNLKSVGVNNCIFSYKDFESLENASYDTIICIESLKHAPDIKTAINGLSNALKNSGQLIVVDDFYLFDIEDSNSIQFKKDWVLNDLIRERDLSNKFNLDRSIDLSQLVKTRPVWMSNLMLITLNIFGFFLKKGFVRLFRGGLLLDILYKQRKMKYKINIYQKATNFDRG